MSTSIKVDGVTLTRGNSKLGAVLNVSLPPPASCDTDMPCFMRGQCYALKHAYNLYGNVREAWNGNMRVWLDRGPEAYFGAIKAAIARVKPALFRWHVGGDIPGPGDVGSAYVGGMCNVADNAPTTSFWCFTKRYDVARANSAMIKATPNLTVILSAWPGVKLDGRTRRAWPVCWVRDSKNPDPRIPATAVTCPGGCDKCQLCAGLGAGDNVVIHKH